ncbi:DUF3738 domain-containing protein [Flavobacterium sp. LB2R40]|uniref:DUF3738 domain-containing protein n=1 Tax=Flavobacterium sp. LB2R40 TaxID=3401722 RepID=UPI003AAB3337
MAPQIISGLFIGFLRVRHGFVLGILMHALHNAFFIGIPLIFMLSTPEKINIKNSIYTIDIEETNNLYGSSSQQNYPDSMAYKSVSLKTTLSYLLDINEIALKTNKKEVLNKTINLNFKNKSKDSSLTKKIVLNQLAKSYNFKIHKRSILTEVWNLRVVNPEILAKYKTTNDYPENIIRTSTEKIVIKKSKIKTLVNALIKETNKIILDKTDLKTNYNFTLQIKNFENLKNQLKNEYGLSLIKQKIYVEYIMILFPQQE